MMTKNYVARIYDIYDEVLEVTYHDDLDMLENIVRGDWDGCPVAKWFDIHNKENQQIVFDFVA